jgi:SSS family solute:Na+ symporter
MIAGLFSGGMLGLFLLGMISKSCTRRAALPATMLGVMVIVWMSISQSSIWPESLARFANPLNPNMTIVVGTSVLLIAGLTINFAYRAQDDSAPH